MRAAEAKRLLEELAGAVDLVLTDIAMPGGLGSELAAEIRSSQGWIRVLYRSRYSREELLNHGIEVSEANCFRNRSCPPSS